jgi:phosphoglycolate phosphatase-like HAD superfamily hydrolase
MDGTLVDSFELIAKSFDCAVRRFLNRTVSTEEALSIPGGRLEEQLASITFHSALSHEP